MMPILYNSDALPVRLNTRGTGSAASRPVRAAGLRAAAIATEMDQSVSISPSAERELFTRAMLAPRTSRPGLISWRDSAWSGSIRPRIASSWSAC